MTLRADLFWSFRSPYSYLATRRYVELTERYDLEIALRQVYPLAVRDRTFFKRNPPNWMRYTMTDVARLAAFYGIPIAPPRPDPIVQDLATGEVAEEQPHIFPLVRMGQVAARRGKGLAYADTVSRLIWGGVEGWNEGDHLRQAAVSVGLDHDELAQEAAEEADALDAEVDANREELEASGHWGVPTLVFNGEPFFGQDRIELAEWRMKQAGLKERV